MDKKEKLFRVKDITKWAGPNDLLHLDKIKEELFKDKEKAFTFMLSKETAELDQKREELNFFSNQCWDEIKRVGKDNGRLLREHFKDMSLT